MTKRKKLTTLEQEVVDVLRRHVINQSRYQVLDITDEMYKKADTMSDEETAKFLQGKDIISDNNLLLLAEEISVKTIFDDEEFIDPVADYIVEHMNDCNELVLFLQT